MKRYGNEAKRVFGGGERWTLAGKMAEGCDFEDKECECYKIENDEDIRDNFAQVTIRVYELLAQLRPGPDFDRKVKQIIEERESVFGSLMEMKTYLMENERFRSRENWNEEFETVEEKNEHN